MRKLYIIGNGFDLNHGLQTSYLNYRHYLELFAPDLKDAYEENEYLQAAECNTDTMWNDVESGLCINYEDAFENMSSVYYPDMTTERTPGWDDIAIEVRNKFSFIQRFTGDRFCQWIKKINHQCRRIESKYRLNKNDIYVTFNYTKTLGNVYSVPVNNIFHIHGVVDNPRTMQFGNPSNNPREIQNDLERTYRDDEFYGVVYDSAISFMRDYAENAYKDVDSNIEKLIDFIRQHSNISEVVVMGHRLFGIDNPYYEQVLVPYFKNCKWTIYVHGDEDKDSVDMFCEEYGIEGVQLVKW